MVSDVIISKNAQQQLEDCVLYVLLEKGNPQAAKSLTQDAMKTMHTLMTIADSLGYCADKTLKSLGYKKILFHKHDYLFLFRIENHIAYIDAVYHQLQDYENLFKDSF